MSLLGDVAWFARENVSEAYRFLEEPNIVEKIIKTRTPSEEIKVEGKEEDDQEPYPLDEEVKIPGDAQVIKIKYQIDRYSNLSMVSRQYAATTPVMVTEEFETKEAADKKWDEDKYSGCFGPEKNENGKYSFTYPARNKFTVGDILTHIYKFYSGEIPEEELGAISKTDDGWGYSKAAKKALDNETVLYREEVMGDCMHFEGLHYVRTNSKGVPIYHVCFGS